MLNTCDGRRRDYPSCEVFYYCRALIIGSLNECEAETFACDDFCKRGSLCAAFVIALYELVGPYPVRSLRAGSFNSRPAAATARLAVFMLARRAAFEPKWDSVKRRS